LNSQSKHNLNWVNAELILYSQCYAEGIGIPNGLFAFALWAYTGNIFSSQNSFFGAEKMELFQNYMNVHDNGMCISTTK
jgi:hypothetical protein